MVVDSQMILEATPKCEAAQQQHNQASNLGIWCSGLSRRAWRHGPCHLGYLWDHVLYGAHVRSTLRGSLTFLRRIAPDFDSNNTSYYAHKTLPSVAWF